MVMSKNTQILDHVTVLFQEHRLLQMGDELSRLASYEQECHRKDGVITTPRDEISELKAMLSENQPGFR